jgi:hypothetical protein
VSPVQRPRGTIGKSVYRIYHHDRLRIEQFRLNSREGEPALSLLSTRLKTPRKAKRLLSAWTPGNGLPASSQVPGVVHTEWPTYVHVARYSPPGCSESNGLHSRKPPPNARKISNAHAVHTQTKDTAAQAFFTTSRLRLLW